MKDNENIYTRKVLFEKYTIKKSILVRDVIYTSLLGINYRYKTRKGEISLLTPCTSTMGMYEIYCPELFHDIKRYDTLLEAEEIIIELLN